MTTDVLDRPPTARENREGKARDIARHAWRLGLSAADLHALPYASRDRAARTMTRFAREAYAAAGTDRQPPHGRTSGTWGIVAEKLEQMTSRAARGLPVPGRDLLADRELWTTGEAAAAATKDQAEEASDREDDAGRTGGTGADHKNAGAGLSHGYTGSEPDRLAVTTPASTAASSTPPPPDHADGLSVFDAILGAKCPGCGWRRGLHRPRIGRLAPCPTSGRTS